MVRPLSADRRYSRFPIAPGTIRAAALLLFGGANKDGTDARSAVLNPAITLSGVTARAASTGWVLRKAICRFGVAGELFDASPKAPRVLIRRDDDGKLAVLTPADLHVLQN